MADAPSELVHQEITRLHLLHRLAVCFDIAKHLFFAVMQVPFVAVRLNLYLVFVHQARVFHGSHAQQGAINAYAFDLAHVHVRRSQPLLRGLCNLFSIFRCDHNSTSRRGT